MVNDQLEHNWNAYNSLKDNLQAEYLGRTALLHDGGLVAI